MQFLSHTISVNCPQKRGCSSKSFFLILLPLQLLCHTNSKRIAPQNVGAVLFHPFPTAKFIPHEFQVICSQKRGYSSSQGGFLPFYHSNFYFYHYNFYSTLIPGDFPPKRGCSSEGGFQGMAYTTIFGRGSSSNIRSMWTWRRVVPH